MDWKDKLYFGDNLGILQEHVAIGVLITLREPTKPMIKEAVSAGFYEPKDFPGRYPRLQILTVAELLEGKKIQFPEHRVETFAKAERKTRHQQEGLFLLARRREDARVWAERYTGESREPRDGHPGP